MIFNDLMGNKIIQIILLFVVIIIGIIIINKYFNSSNKNSSSFVNIVSGLVYSKGPDDIPKIDKILIENEINLPNRDPRFLTTSMIIPNPENSEENKKKIRMEILNMFYSSQNEDIINIDKRPKGLFIVP